LHKKLLFFPPCEDSGGHKVAKNGEDPRKRIAKEEEGEGCGVEREDEPHPKHTEKTGANERGDHGNERAAPSAQMS
jgi:hypothetical protein